MLMLFHAELLVGRDQLQDVNNKEKMKPEFSPLGYSYFVLSFWMVVLVSELAITNVLFAFVSE